MQKLKKMKQDKEIATTIVLDNFVMKSKWETHFLKEMRYLRGIRNTGIELT